MFPSISMDPQYEQRLRDEVIYLHSLWHQGPPRSTAVSFHLQPVKATQFKKQKTGTGKSKQKSTNIITHEFNSSPGAEWPCPASPPPPSTTGWPTCSTLVPKPNSRPPPPEEQSNLAPKRAYQKAVKAVYGFLMNKNSEDSDAIDSSSDEDDEVMEEDFVDEKYNFFFKIFKDDTELREFYEKNFAKEEFNCLVCRAIGGKGSTKKFKGCLSLVQHSITIAKTKKRRAHRAFGQAVCKVLGWDIDNLPAIVSMLSEKPGDKSGSGSSDNKKSSTTLANNADSVNNVALEGKHEEADLESVCIQPGVSGIGDEGHAISVAGAGKNLEDSSMVLADNMEEPASDGVAVISITGAGKYLEDGSMVRTDNVEEPASDRVAFISITGAGKYLEDGSVMCTYNVEETASDGVAINSLARADDDQNLENLGMVYQHNMEEPALLELVVESSACPDADKNQTPGIVYQHEVEQPMPEGLTINSSTSTDMDRNLDNIGVMHPQIIKDVETESPRNVSGNNNNDVLDEVQMG